MVCLTAAVLNGTPDRDKLVKLWCGALRLGFIGVSLEPKLTDNKIVGTAQYSARLLHKFNVRHIGPVIEIWQTIYVMGQ